MMAFAVAAPTPPAEAQQEAPLHFSLSEESDELRMRVGAMFDSELTQALHSGLPIRIQVVAELWKDGFFDSQRGRADWRASVIFDPLERRYRVASGTDGAIEAVVDALDGVENALRDQFVMRLAPHERGRFYYTGQITVETLSLSDLGELQRWLRGDLTPSVAEDRNRETAMGKGVRRLLVRVLGLPARRFPFRSPKFDHSEQRPG